MGKNRKLSISLKIILMTFILLSTSIVIPAVLVFVNSQKTLLETAQNELNQTALLTQKALNSWIGFLKMDMETLTGFNTIQNSIKSSFLGRASRKSAGDQLNRKIDEFKFYESIFITDKDGMVVVSTDTELLNTDISNAPYFSNLKSNTISIGNLSINIKSGKTNFVIASPISINSEVTGAVISTIDLGYFETDFIAPIRLGKSGFVSLLSPSGLYISHPDRSAIMKKNVVNLELKEALSQASEGVVSYDAGDRQQISAFRKLPNLKWVVVVTAFSDELLAPVKQLAIINGIIALVIFILATIVSVVVAGKLKSPLVKAVNMLNDLARGDFSNRIEVKTNDEAEEMADSMNRLAEDLQKAVSEINLVMKKVSTGDLSDTVDANLQGELATLQLSINNSIDLLSETISHVVDTSINLKAGTDEIQAAANNLANGTSQQAASLEEITSSMNEIESQTKQNDINASEANQLASVALETVKSGNSKMSNLQQAMIKISDTSSNVSKVIKVIDEIAFQTNLLALNAAVEAARAGKYGKGFAVVAEEVRNLAGRSAVAAKDTTELIESSIKEVENGVVNSNETAEVLSQITESVGKITDLVSEISTSSKEQNQGIKEVNLGLIQVNNVVQQNSSISEQTSSSAQELSTSANHLLRLIDNFVLKTSSKRGPETKSSILKPVKKPTELEMDSAKPSDHPNKLLILDENKF